MKLRHLQNIRIFFNILHVTNFSVQKFVNVFWQWWYRRGISYVFHKERERESLCVGLCVVKSQVRLSILIVGYSSSNNESDFDECNFFSYETNFLKTLKDEKDEIKRRWFYVSYLHHQKSNFISLKHFKGTFQLFKQSFVSERLFQNQLF
jgi:hypothetical protein